MEENFSEFLCKVLNSLLRNEVGVERFRLFIITLYREISDDEMDSIESIFEHLTRSELWDFWNYHHLGAIIKQFGGRDTRELEKLEKEYQEKLSAFLAITKIRDYILTSQEQLVHQVGHSTSRRRSIKAYRLKLSVKLDADISTHTLKYIEGLWKKLSYLHLPKIGVLLDRIHDGCISVVWLVTPDVSIKFLEKAREATQFYKDNDIIRIMLNGDCIYSAPTTEEETTFTDSDTVKSKSKVWRLHMCTCVCV